ncbi:mRNA-decapping enzyme 1A [Neodiprion virginianus]|uniref:mRNA-decapping enzyme 1A isoform X1 n=2 Tax=Neodiprion lecontei TaxID=441921 RepID=A0A6J0BAZ6_NEOLC|nr:mRNA-decapping enzyme 1A isoform X1 [Neodiprion lecontei]XP_046414788.1 mRNA-decapping enzyme 1A [Neodiprion fabricii]XP_046604206.1 mRNA-decapping enzyme 1A [Neodiprion virginianus]
MADLTELKMNVAALKRVDPYVKDILETATHVALYTFNAENNEWEKTDVEGALFVYSRNGEPYNSVLIMNRLNTNNLMEPVTQGLDLQLQEPFLLYRNSSCNIFGIWFYEKEECVRIAAMLNKLVKDSEQMRKSTNKVKTKKNSGPSVNSVDIFSMLSKAQEDFNTNRGGPKSPGNNLLLENMTGPLSAPLGPDVPSQSVMDFFAKAKVNPGQFKAGDQPPTGNPGPTGPVTPETKPLLARLMSNPAAHTLEHIEKQQRSTTPQPGPPSHSQSQSASTIQPNNVSGNIVNRSKRRNRITTTNLESGGTTVSTAVPREQPPLTNANSTDTNSTSGFLRIQSPTNTTLNNHQQSSIPNANSLASLFAHATGPTASVESSSCSAVGSGPALMPPVMFAAPSPPDPLTRPVEPLTRNQLLQAFNYLLRSDPDFVNKLHEAYVKSFGEILS